MPEPQDSFPVSRGLLAALFTAAFFVSPLIFFTGLTRNPYYFQIALLNVSVLGAAALFLSGSLKRGAWLLSASAPGRPLAALALVYLVSFLVSLAGHPAFFRPAMAAEGLRASLFFAVNCLAVFYLARAVPFSGDEETQPGRWLTLVLVWGGLWFLFPFLRSPGGGDGLLDRLLDPYGLLLWAAGAAAVWMMIRRCRQEDILDLALAAGTIASLYGILQYFRIELVWAKLVNPYGNRSVSTFGNPNFISSYVVLFLPLAASLLMKARTGAGRAFYGLAFLSYGGMLMCSLTRSSWLGAAAAMGLLFAFPSHRGQLKANRRFLYPFFAAALLLAFLWPSDSLRPFSSGLVERVTQAASGVADSSSLGLAKEGGKVYGSFHQRLLIWTSAWQMGLESPLLGKGWGQFELFYPFFQGRLLLNYPGMRHLRTHANNAHNEVLEQWSQAGLLGLGIYLWFLAVLFYGFWRFYRAAGEGPRYAAVPLAAGLAGMLADNMLNVSLHFAVPALGFWWVAGALSLKVFPAAAPAPWRRPRLAAAAAWLLLAGTLAGAWFWQRQFMREFHYFNGFRLMRVGNTGAAVQELERAWRYHSREVNGNYELGNAYIRSGDLEKCVWAYSEALKSNAGYDEIYFNQAIVLKRLGRMEEARKHLQVSALINPVSMQVWQALAETYLSAPDRGAVAAAAAGDFREAVKAFPYDGNLWNTLGYFQTLLKDYSGARDSYAMGAMADPENRMLTENLAGVSRQLGLKGDKALAWLEDYRGLSAALGSIQPGPAHFEKADALAAAAPHSLKARALRAKLLFKAGKLDEAAADLRGILAANPDDNSARYGLAVIHEKKGDTAAARAEWETFLILEPGNAAVAARLKALGGSR